MPLAVELHRAGFETRHIEHVGGQFAHAHRLFEDRFGQFPPRFVGQIRSLFDEAARGAGDDGERRAQVVRDRRKQRIAQAFRRDAEFGFLSDLDEVDAFERERDLRGERFEQPLLFRHEDQTFVARLQRQHAAIAHRRA